MCGGNAGVNSHEVAADNQIGACCPDRHIGGLFLIASPGPLSARYRLCAVDAIPAAAAIVLPAAKSRYRRRSHRHHAR
jgi:hypothetical protein